jgi:hypothetical protein
MYTILELVSLTGLPYGTVWNHVNQGYCKWPRKQTLGQSKDLAYKCWENMVQRCTNPKSAKYELYGGRGITLSPEFISFQKFIKYIGPRPSKYHSIDRINTNGNYEPGNVRWATSTEQANNMRGRKSTGDGIEKHGRHYRFRYQGKIQKYLSWEEAAEAKDTIYGKGYW